MQKGNSVIFKIMMMMVNKKQKTVGKQKYKLKIEKEKI